ncbi:hypothetical protein ACK311_20425 [Aeromonas caviae]|uniref:hypothetical protein n=1 Tax=Aeromonas caviae TaxID=648 RepID=UPI001FBBA039|nr:hypothetical protein [Aeromonas caviae]BDO07842.1 hypothetical protein KAM643c_14150 [Aeromonas caviae]GKR80673.1 hypothetical protein KAM481_41430 [Aeromonas caviae]
MTNELPLTHYSRQWLGLVAAKAKLQPTRRCERWLLHLTPGSPNARTVTLHLRWSGMQWQLRIPAKLNSHSGQREHPDP